MSHLYVHIPFCAHRCGYCDFVATSDLGAIPSYISALKEELVLLHSRFISTEEIVLPLKTIYIGGGTPSILSGERIKEVLIAITSLFGQPTLE
jgi:oxygen-independent coproporphyrinogen-3 oxidase